MKIPDNPLYFHDQDEWRAWLSKNHASEKKAWLVLNKSRVSGPGMNLPQAIEEALCFGWIDSILQRKDENTYVLRFTPRKPRSIWSVSNQKRVEQLLAQGRMTEAGMVEVRRAHENGEWEAAIRREKISALPEALAVAFSEHPDALPGKGQPASSITREHFHLNYLPAAGS